MVALQVHIATQVAEGDRHPQVLEWTQAMERRLTFPERRLFTERVVLVEEIPYMDLRKQHALDQVRDQMQ
jgi:hypothetical protein